LPSDGGDGVVRIVEQNDQTVAVHIRRRSSKALMIEFDPLRVGQPDAVSHGDLPAAPPPVPRPTESRQIDESFWVSA
jgi:hypothetical protein